MLFTKQLRELVIEPALKAIDLYSKGAEELLVATCAHESKDGYYLKQLSNVPDAALGIYQMQPSTHESLWNTKLTSDSYLGLRVMTACNYTLRPKAEVMIYNLKYSSIMARIFWLQIPDLLPDPDDLEEIWYLYKRYWNTLAGKATKDDFFSNYDKFVRGD